MPWLFYYALPQLRCLRVDEFLLALILIKPSGRKTIGRARRSRTDIKLLLILTIKRPSAHRTERFSYNEMQALKSPYPSQKKMSSILLIISPQNAKMWHWTSRIFVLFASAPPGLNKNKTKVIGAAHASIIFLCSIKFSFVRRQQQIWKSTFMHHAEWKWHTFQALAESSLFLRVHSIDTSHQLYNYSRDLTHLGVNIMIFNVETQRLIINPSVCIHIKFWLEIDLLCYKLSGFLIEKSHQTFHHSWHSNVNFDLMPYARSGAIFTLCSCMLRRDSWSEQQKRKGNVSARERKIAHSRAAAGSLKLQRAPW